MNLFLSFIEEDDKGNIITNQKFKDKLQNSVQFDKCLIEFVVNITNISEKELKVT